MPQARISTLSTLRRISRRPWRRTASASIALDAFERVGDRARLLEDFLLHEVAVRAELDRIAATLRRRRSRARPRLPLRVVDRVGLAAHVGDVAFFEIDDAARDRQQRRGVGREEVIAVADADDQRAARPRADDAARLARRDHGDRVGAVKLGDRRAAPRAADRRRRRACQCEWTRCAMTSVSVCVREHVALRLAAGRAAPRSSR